MGAITVSGLQRAAEKYDPILRKLPFAVLADELAALQINLMDVTVKDTLIEFERRGGTTKPYSATSPTVDLTTETGKLIERSLTVSPCVNVIKDHIMAYRDKAVLNATGDKVDNQGKKHPLEQLFIESHVRTVSEDILDALFFAERNEADKTPMGLFDGIKTIITDETSAGAIAVAKGNLVNTSAIATPSGETDYAAFTTVLNFIRAAHPQLRKNCVLYISRSAYFHVVDALGNKLKYKNVMDVAELNARLKDLVGAQSLSVIPTDYMGTGSNLILSAPRNIDLGMNTASDAQFVQVRNPYEDANYVQFWLQFEAGMRVRHIHEKMFQTNNQVNTSVALSGDYVS